MLLTAISVLDSTLAVNVDVSVQDILQNQTWFKEYIVPSLGIVGVLLGFFLVKRGTVLSKYNYYIKIHKSLNIYFEVLDEMMLKSMEIFKGNVQVLNARVKNKPT